MGRFATKTEFVSVTTDSVYPIRPLPPLLLSLVVRRLTWRIPQPTIPEIPFHCRTHLSDWSYSMTDIPANGCTPLARVLGVSLLLAAAGCQPANPPATDSKPREAVQPAKTDPAEAAALEGKPMLTVQSEPYGETEDGKPITQFTLQNEAGLQVRLINFGATVTAVLTPDRDGKLANINVGYNELASYERPGPYFGATVGRYANRIANGKFSLDGKEYTLATNNGKNHLHGGVVGFNRKVWKAEPVEGPTAVGVKFTYVSPDGEEGYPGTLTTTVTYSLTNKNELKVDYTATTDAPTVLNLTNHNYWNLSGVNSGKILEHVVQLNADKYLPVDETAIPLGEQAPVAGTPMDFLKPHPIGDHITETVNGGGGYDHCYVLSTGGSTENVAATVFDPKSGRVLEISTTEPGIQFYTGNFLDGKAESAGNEKQGAFCLEANHFPDSPNHPDFPTTVLRPGETYKQTTIHKFSVRK